MTTVALQLMITVCHVFPLNLVCNWIKLACEKYYCSCVTGREGVTTQRQGAIFWVTSQKRLGNTDKRMFRCENMQRAASAGGRCSCERHVDCQ